MKQHLLASDFDQTLSFNDSGLEELDGYQFTFNVISAAPEEVIRSALEDIVGWDSSRIHELFETHGFVLQEWGRIRTDTLTIRAAAPPAAVA